MCGIAGVIMSDRQGRHSAAGLRRMGQVLHHRGPDAYGFWEEAGVGLAHRRLSIIDVASGQQPMSSRDGRVHLTFNGEIYNYPDLRLELEQLGYTFRTQSDTEVLLALYLQYGVEAFPKLNGMFACAFWDARESRLVLARDRFGKKPLFYHVDGQRLLFGSELKAILAYGDLSPQVNASALHEYLTHSYRVGDETMVQGIKQVPPAHWLTLKNGQVSLQRYWRFRFAQTTTAPREEEAIERVEQFLRAAVKRRLMSEVPLGAFLSGGLDSSVVVALMAGLSNQAVRTFTIGFEESEYSELEDARVVARHLGTAHQEIIVKPSGMDVLPKLVWHLDEPFGDSSAVPTYYVCEAARRHVTVAISGDGGDETFAGYARYLQLDRRPEAARIPAWVRRGLIAPLTSRLPFTTPGWNYLHAVGRHVDGELPLTLGIYPYIQAQLYSRAFAAQVRGLDAFAHTTALQREVSGLDPVSRYQYADTLDYLPNDILVKVDRMSMANSLEVRSPLLDYTLVEYLATLPASLKVRQSLGKHLLRRLVTKWLPESVLAKRKQGFALPKDRWFRHDHRRATEEILFDSRTIGRGYFRPETVRRLLAHHAAGRRDYSNWIWCLVVLELWFRQFIDEAATAASPHSTALSADVAA